MSEMANTTEHSSEQWYDQEDPKLDAKTVEVLEQYSNIPKDRMISHVRSIVYQLLIQHLTRDYANAILQRDKAWAIHKYPCIGQWRFLDLSISKHRLYPEVLSRMRTGEQTFLDLGCAFAQDIRCLVADGVDSSKCFGADLRLDFIDLGYDLFNDRDTLRSKFIAADIFDADSPLEQLDGSIDVVGASSFFHLFSWEEQKTVAKRVSKLLRPCNGSLIVGRQVGNEQPGEKARLISGGGGRYRHNIESWRKLWTEVGDEIGVTWEVDGHTRPMSETFSSIGDLGMEFSVRRL